MILTDPAALAECRARERCEVPGCRARGAEAHHLFSRGYGGGSRLDVSWLLCLLCNGCHTGLHYRGRPSRKELLAVAARREKCQPEDIRQARDILLSLPKEAEPGSVALGTWSEVVSVAARRMVLAAVVRKWELAATPGRKLRKKKWPTRKRRSR